MEANRVMVIGEKENFLIRVIMKKLSERKIASVFVPWDIDAINSHLEGTGLVTVYMEDGKVPPEKPLRFLIDKMIDEGLIMVSVGGEKELEYLKGQTSPDMIYRAFKRPMDNEAYADTVGEIFARVESGEFRKTVLIVDDDVSFLGIMREWLKNTYKVAMANSGLQAIKWLGKNKADLILLDYEMPVTNGAKVLEMLRSDDETKDIPVIFLTGKSDRKSVMEVVELKPQGYFLKTISMEELLEKLEEFFIRQKNKEM